MSTSEKDSEVIIKPFVILKEGTREAVGTIFVLYPEHFDTDERPIEFVPRVLSSVAVVANVTRSSYTVACFV